MKTALTKIVWTHRDIYPKLRVGCINEGCENDASYIMDVRDDSDLALKLPVCLKCAGKPHEVLEAQKTRRGRHVGAHLADRKAPDSNNLERGALYTDREAEK